MGRNDTVMGAEICHVHVTLGEEMTEEVEMLTGGHEDTMVVSIVKSLLGWYWMAEVTPIFQACVCLVWCEFSVTPETSWAPFSQYLAYLVSFGCLPSPDKCALTPTTPWKKHNTYIFMSNSILFLPGSTARVSLQNPWRWILRAGCWEEWCAAFLGQAHGNFLYAVFVIYFLYPRSPRTESGGLREQKGYPCIHVSIRPLCKEEVNREYVKLLHFCFTFFKITKLLWLTEVV